MALPAHWTVPFARRVCPFSLGSPEYSTGLRTGVCRSSELHDLPSETALEHLRVYELRRNSAAVVAESLMRIDARRRTNASPPTARDLCIGISARVRSTPHPVGRPPGRRNAINPDSGIGKGLICSGVAPPTSVALPFWFTARFTT